MIKKHKLNDNIKYYTSEEKDNISSKKIKIVENINDIDDFIKEELNKKTSNSKIYIGKINDSVANKIKKVIGLDLTNYNISLKGNNVRKIIKDHGNSILENLRGQEAITIEDFNYIDDIVLEADKIFLSGKTKQGKDVITFEKKINNKYTLVEFISSRQKTLETQTMFKSIKKNSFTADNTKSPIPTSKTNSDSSSL